MSAIAGLWRFDDKPDPDVDCARMLASQEIYGPHDGRLWSAGPLAMGRRLFQTLPEDDYDEQPLRSRDGRLVLTADVRVDNREELRSALGLSAAEASRLCDAAFLLKSLDRWGEAALDRIAGDFAFALWDSHAQKLLLGRDFLGQRPLHYHCGKGFFAFASMPKGLHALPEIPYAPDERAMAEFVTLLPRHGPRSFFEAIHRVEAGCVVSVTRDGLSTRHYWQPARPASSGMRSDYVEGLRHHLDQATQSRLRGVNGAVGAKLSAGFDSAAVTATAARLLAPSAGQVVAFTAVPRAGYDGPVPRNRIADEGPLAAATAAMYENIEHVLIRSGERTPFDDLDRTFFLLERPVLGPTNWVWISAIAAAARDRKLGILLTGQMGNLTISYDGITLLPELLRRGRLIRLGRTAAELVAKRQLSRRGAVAEIFGPFVPPWLWQSANRVVHGIKMNLLHYTAIRAERLAEMDMLALAQERDLDLAYRPRRDGFDMRVWAMRRTDIGEYNTAFRAGWGVDSRDPTADKRLVEYCLTVPMEEYLAGNTRRSLAKRALADRIPAAVLGERRRGYQAADWHERLTAGSGDAARELDRLAPCAPARKLLDIERLKTLVENWPTSGWDQESVMQAYRLALVRGISAGHFLRKATRTNQ